MELILEPRVWLYALPPPVLWDNFLSTSLADVHWLGLQGAKPSSTLQQDLSLKFPTAFPHQSNRISKGTHFLTLQPEGYLRQLAFWPDSHSLWGAVLSNWSTSSFNTQSSCFLLEAFPGTHIHPLQHCTEMTLSSLGVPRYPVHYFQRLSMSPPWLEVP